MSTGGESEDPDGKLVREFANALKRYREAGKNEVAPGEKPEEAAPAASVEEKGAPESPVES